MKKDISIAVVGLGYVGFPLALAFGKTNIKTTGFDVKEIRIKQLKTGYDVTGEIKKSEILSSKLRFTSDPKDLKQANFFIIAVPTPVTKNNKPDMSLVMKATQTVAKIMQPGSVIVYESTVYPGATEEDCVPVLEKFSGLKWKKDFFIGYSPERINPGDTEHSLEKVIKVVAGDSPESTKIIASAYKKVCKAGIHIAPNIKTAEAAKVIENAQRDINIALMNELSLIFHRMHINTNEVLAAAGTKWNFLRFTPGLVGGHCIGVDPYYLVHKAKKLGYKSHVITAGRFINDFMPVSIAKLTVDGIEEAGKSIKNAKILVMGLTFKENVKDYRNSKIAVTIDLLKQQEADITGFDPHLDEETIQKEFGIKSLKKLTGKFDGIIIATPHKKFYKMTKEILECCDKNVVVFDVKSIFPKMAFMENVIYKNL